MICHTAACRGCRADPAFHQKSFSRSQLREWWCISGVCVRLFFFALWWATAEKCLATQANGAALLEIPCTKLWIGKIVLPDDSCTPICEHAKSWPRSCGNGKYLLMANRRSKYGNNSAAVEKQHCTDQFLFLFIHQFLLLYLFTIGTWF